VNEKNGSWWVAGGRVDAPESFTTGAMRECVEEAGIDVDIKGILRIEQSPGLQFSRLKSKICDILVIYYGEPKNTSQVPKQFADKESLGAAYFSVEEIIALKSKWRGPELYEWAKYLEAGGHIHPLSILRDMDVAQ
jgi:8-oxo-dGTP pyrophosphatase MutT (NUDIX family)